MFCDRKKERIARGVLTALAAQEAYPAAVAAAAALLRT